MRVLIIQETDWLKRYSGQQHHLAEILSLRGHEVRVIDHELLWKARGAKGVLSKREVFPDVSKVYQGARITVIRPGIVRLPLLEYVSLALAQRREIGRQMADFRPDAIVGFGILSSRTAAGMTRKTPVPFVYYWIDVLHSLIPAKPLQPIGRMVERAALGRADRVLANCQQLKEYLLTMGAPGERMGVISEGVDIDRFDPASNGGRLRGELGLGPEDVVLLFMGWLYTFSGLREVARDLPRAGNRHLKLLVVGKGDLYDELREMGRMPELAGRLLLAGERPYQEIPEYVAAADICLLPAYPGEKVMRHIVPIKVFEYLAGGRPVISTRLPGVIAEFGEGHGVVYVDRPEDVLARADELSRTGGLKALGSQGRAFVEKNDWNRIADDFEVVLQGAIAEKRAGRTA